MVGRIVVESVRLASCANTKFCLKIAGNAADQLTVNVAFGKNVAENTAAVHCVLYVSWYAAVPDMTSTASIALSIFTPEIPAVTRAAN